MNNNTIRIIAAVVDVHNLTLYKDTGETVVIPQGDPRVRPIVEEITPLLISQGYAEISIRAADVNHYAQFEEQSNGIVKFFRVAKDRLKNLFAKEAKESPLGLVPALSVGPVPTPPQTTPAIEHIKSAGIYDVSEQDEVDAANDMAIIARNMAAVTEIMQHAVPVSAPEFHEDTVAKQGNVVEDSGITNKSTKDAPEPDTIIAVVDNKIIPGMEKIKSQFARATKMGSTHGVENFLKRLGTVINQRSHSVEDLLKFMERADTPIADDGSIIIYKVLTRCNRNGQGRYVDCHTKKVEQWAGAYVCMDPSLVDHDRSQECSNGLHVARRGYIREFNGDVCVLAKLAPEDVIAVPSYDANKMRVCGYHILMELSDAQYALLKQNKPITDDPQGKELLAMAIAGRHVRRTHEVRITGHKGEGVVTTSLTKSAELAAAAKALPESPKAVEALGNATEEIKDVPVDPKDVVTAVAQLSRKDQAAHLYRSWQAAKRVYGGTAEAAALEALQAFKKAAKVGWDRLGINDPAVTGSGAFGSIQKPVVTKTKGKTKDKKKGKGKTKLIQFVEPKKVPDVFNDKRIVNSVELGEGSPRERIQKLLAIGLTSVGVAQAILDLKKQSKKSWGTLGVTDDQLNQILKLTKKS